MKKVLNIFFFALLVFLSFISCNNSSEKKIVIKYLSPKDSGYIVKERTIHFFCKKGYTIDKNELEHFEKDFTLDGFYIYDYFTMTDKSNLAYEDPLNMPDTSKIEFLKLRNKVIDDVLHVYAYYVKKYEITINGSTDLNEILPQEINPSNITWESEDPNIATVNQSGVVSVIREGQTNIIAKDQNGKIIAICHVFTGNTSESSIPIQSITLKEDWVCVNINDTLAFDFFDIVPANANEKIQFESSKPVALSVSGETITGKKQGFQN